MYFFRRYLLALIMAGLAGIIACASPRTIMPSDTGQTAVFQNVTKKQVFTAAAKTISRQLILVNYDLELGVIRAESRTSLMNWGEVVAVFITESSSGEVRLKVVSKSRSRLQLGGRDWALAIINAVRVELNQMEEKDEIKKPEQRT